MGLPKKQCMKGQYSTAIRDLELTDFLKIKRKKIITELKFSRANRTELYGLLIYNIPAPRDTKKNLKSVAYDRWVGWRSCEILIVYRMLKSLQDKPFHNLPLLWKINLNQQNLWNSHTDLVSILKTCCLKKINSMKVHFRNTLIIKTNKQKIF